MAVLPLVLGWLVLAADPSPSAGALGGGSAVELADFSGLARLRDPLATPFLFSTPSAGAQGRAVIAEVVGPGVIQRIWLARAEGLKEARLKVDLDGQPALDIDLETLFTGGHPHFPRPLVGEGSGGLYCYVPIAFRERCRITVDDRFAREFQIEGRKLPKAEGVEPFSDTPTEAEQAALKTARALWKRPDVLFSRERKDKALVLVADSAEFSVDGGARSTQLFALPPGPRTIRSLEAVPTPGTAEAWRSARIRIVWDGDDVDRPAVDVPLGDLFGYAGHMHVYQSVLVGQVEQTWANRFPMPYRERALLQIDSERPIQGMIRVRSVARTEPGSGYFRAGVRSETGFHATGRGQYVGTFLVAETTGAPPVGLDRADRAVVDDHSWTEPRVFHSFNSDSAAPGAQVAGDREAVWPLHGFPVFRREGNRARLAAFRWRLADALPFTRSLTINGLGADVHVVDFWYSEQAGPGRSSP